MLSPWKPWAERESIPGVEYRGVYVQAQLEESPRTRKFFWTPLILYIGILIAAQRFMQQR